MEQGFVFVAWKFECAKLAEVVGDPLGVEEEKSGIAEDGDGDGEGGFRCVGFSGEHAFAKKRPAEGDSVKSALEAIGVPAFNAVGDTEAVEGGIGLDDLFIDPRAIAFGTAAHGGGEVVVDADLERALAQGRAEAAVKVEAMIERDDASHFRREPMNAPALSHGEDAAAVCAYEDVGLEIADHGGSCGVMNGAGISTCFQFGSADVCLMDKRAATFTARILREGKWVVAYSPEFPEGNGQGLTEEEALESLRESILLLFEDRREDARANLANDEKLVAWSLA